MLFHCTGVGLLNIFHFEISWMEGKINQKKKSLELDQKRGVVWKETDLIILINDAKDNTVVDESGLKQKLIVPVCMSSPVFLPEIYQE